MYYDLTALAVAIVVGFAITLEVDRSIYLQEMDVDPKHGQRGIGTALIETISDWAQFHRYDTISLGVDIEVKL